jgi:aspartate ammonia-lyase
MSNPPQTSQDSPASVRGELRSIEFLDGLTDTDLHFLSSRIKRESWAANDLLFEEGAPRTAFMLLTEGTVSIEKQHSSAAPVRLASFGAGDAIGEGLLLDETAHGTTGRALEPTSALVLRIDALKEIVRERPTLYAGLVAGAARAISKRLSATDATLVGRGRRLGFGGTRTRLERDLLGEREVPDDALYGVQTLRALENFPISGVTLRDFPDIIKGVAAVKAATARSNAELGLLEPALADVIAQAAEEIRTGRHHEHFLVDMFQGGAGTSTNMNANEVIANRALEIMGKKRGEYKFCSPNSHVNLSQSTNDVYPTALKLALHASIDNLREAMKQLAEAFLERGEAFSEHIKMGRTQLQDAVPMTLGQEFRAFGVTILEDVDRLGEAQQLIREINMGATAIGTGITAPPEYPAVVRRHLSEIVGFELITAPDLVEATADTGVFVQLSGVLKRCAVKLSKICNDLRLLSSGPRAGFGEINLPPMQPGSSIMPGKVNPVIPEVVNQVCFDVIGGDVTVTMAAEAGQLQLNVFEPVIAFRLLRGLDAMRNACVVLRERCVTGITANPERMRWFVENSIGIVTALVPILGYETATEIAKEALASGRGVYDLVCDKGLMTREQLDRLLNPSSMTQDKKPAASARKTRKGPPDAPPS